MEKAVKEKKKTLFTVIAIDLLVVFLLLSVISAVNSLDTVYYQLRGKGDSMYPTIKDGQSITVQMPVDIESIKVDDIIVYGSIAALAYMPNPECIWIGHRVTEKYQKNGQWWFRTKGDNNPETDPWEVPYYWVTGIVINIEQTKPITTPEETSIEPTQTDSQTFLRIEIVLPIAGSLSLGALIMTMLHLRDRKQANMLRKANIHSCYTCQQYETQSTQRLVSVSGGWKLIRIPQLSRGLCSYYNQEIHAFHRRKCEHYQPKNLKEPID